MDFGAEDPMRFWDGVSVRQRADKTWEPCLKNVRHGWVVPDSLRPIGFRLIADAYAPSREPASIRVTYSTE